MGKQHMPHGIGSLGGRSPHPVTVGAHDAALMEMIGEGKSTAAIGAVFGCDGKTIRMRLNALIASDHQMPEKPCALHPVTQGLHDHVILKMRAAKVTFAVIGRTFGCSDRLVSERVRLILAAEQPEPEAALETGAPTVVAVPQAFIPVRPKATERRCLGGCGRMRDSTGPGDRICKNCKGTEAWRSGGDAALSGVRLHDR